MAEIINVDHIGGQAMHSISGISYNNENKTAYVSGNFSTKNLASYSIEPNGKMYNGPNYILKILGKNIKSISSYKQFLLAVSNDDCKIYIISDDHVGVSELKVQNTGTHLCDDLTNYLLNPILEITKKCTNICLNLEQIIIINNSVYFFVQTQCSHFKGNMLFVLEGSLCDQQLILKEKVVLQTFFNLYKNGRTNGFSRDISKQIKLKGACFNPDKNEFVLLLSHSSDGYLTKIKKYTEIDGMSTMLETIYDQSNKIFILKNNPVGITYFINNSFVIINSKKNINNLIEYCIIKN